MTPFLSFHHTSEKRYSVCAMTFPPAVTSGLIELNPRSENDITGMVLLLMSRTMCEHVVRATGIKTCNVKPAAHLRSTMQGIRESTWIFWATSTNTARQRMMVDPFSKWVECIPLPSQRERPSMNILARFRYSLWEFHWPRHLCSIAYTQDQDNRVSTFGKWPGVKIKPNPDGCRSLFHPKAWHGYLAKVAGALRCAVNRQTEYAAK